MATDRKTRSRLRLINLGAVGPGEGAAQGPKQEVVEVGLSYRVVISEQAEVWTVNGVLRDGTVTKEDIGELSLVLLPGTEEPATAITGFVTPSGPYVLAMTEAKLREDLRAMLVQLGYDRDGYYLSVAYGGSYLYDEAVRTE